MLYMANSIGSRYQLVCILSSLQYDMKKITDNIQEGS